MNSGQDGMLTETANKAADTVRDFLADDNTQVDEVALETAWEKLQNGDIEGARAVIASAVAAKFGGEVTAVYMRLPAELRKTIYDDIAKYPDKAFGELLDLQALRDRTNQEDFAQYLRDYVQRYQTTFSESATGRITIAGKARGIMAAFQGWIGGFAKIIQAVAKVGGIQMSPQAMAAIDQIVAETENYQSGRFGTEGDVERAPFEEAAAGRPVIQMSPEELSGELAKLGEALTDEMIDEIEKASPEELEGIIQSLNASADARDTSADRPTTPGEGQREFQGKRFTRN